VLFSTLNQGWLFLLFIAFAIVVNAILLSPSLITKKKLNNKILGNLLVTLVVIINTVLWWWLNLKLNYGEIRFYLIGAYLLGFWVIYTFFKHFHKDKNKTSKLGLR